MEQKDVEVTLADNILTIKGERKEEKEEKENGYRCREMRYGSFYREVEVPEGLNHEKVEAHFKNGILTVTAPRLEEVKAKSKKIAITVD